MCRDADAPRDALFALLAWFDYCDDVVGVAQGPVVEALTRRLFTVFFCGCLQPHLMAASEATACAALVLADALLRRTTTDAMCGVWARFLTAPMDADTGHGSLCSTVIGHASAASDELSVAAMTLLDALLALYNEAAVHRLLLRPLLPRAHLLSGPDAPAAARATLAALDALVDDADGDYGPTHAADSADRFASLLAPDALGADDPAAFDDDLDACVFAAQERAVHALARCRAWTCLQRLIATRPVARGDGACRRRACSLSSEASDDDLQRLLGTAGRGPDVSFAAVAPEQCSDADDAVARLQRVSDLCAWPSDAAGAAASAFHEADLMRMVLDRVEGMLTQSCAVNAAVARLVLRLCTLPHPLLTSYLLDATLPLRPDVRSLYRSLSRLCDAVRARAARVRVFPANLAKVRRQLAQRSSDAASSDAEHRASSARRYYEGVVLLQELCMELAAACLAAFNVAALQPTLAPVAAADDSHAGPQSRAP